MKDIHICFLVLILLLLLTFNGLLTFDKELLISKDGDYIIEFIMSVHDGEWQDGQKKINLLNLLAVEAILSKIEEINSNPNVLPNITIGYIINDDYGSKQRTTKIAMSLLSRIAQNGYNSTTKCRRIASCKVKDFGDNKTDSCGPFNKPVIAVVGGTTSDMSMWISTVLRPIKIPIVSYLATSEKLRNVNFFPFMVNLVPSDKYQAKAIMDLIHKFKWTYVLAVVSSTYYGLEGLAMLEKEAAKMTVCLHSRTILIPSGDTSNNTSIRKTVQDIKKDRRLKVVIAFMYIDEVKRVFQEVERQNVTGITWIASDAWTENDAILEFPPHLVIGILGVRLQAKAPGQKKRSCRRMHIKLNVWSIPFLCQHYNLSQQNCSLSSLSSFRKNMCFDRVFPTSMAYMWTFAENAILTVTHALNSLISQTPTFDYTDMLNSIKFVRNKSSLPHDVQFTGYIGPSVVNYSVVNLQLANDSRKLKFVQVGSWSEDLSKPTETNRKLNLHNSLIQWNKGKAPQSRCSEPCPDGHKIKQGPHRCCWHCEACPLGYISSTDTPHVCIKCPDTEHPNPRQNQCVADTQIFFCINQPIGIAILTICSFGEILGFVLFAILRRYKDHIHYVALPFKKLSFVLMLIGFLHPIAYLQRISLLVCHVRAICFTLFLNTHACFLLCSCGKARYFVSQMHSFLINFSSKRRRQRTMLARKAWTRSMRKEFMNNRQLKEAKPVEHAGHNRNRDCVNFPAPEKVKNEYEKEGTICRNSIRKDRIKPKRSIEESRIEEKTDTKNKEQNIHLRRFYDITHHALYAVALILTSLPLVVFKGSALVKLNYTKLSSTSGYKFCTFGNNFFIELFALFHIPPLVLTLLLTNQTKTTAINRKTSSDAVDISLFYVHDRFVYYQSYLILLIECICFPFSFVLPGPRERDILKFTVTLAVQFSFVLTTYGTKLYAIYRERSKSK